jgi:hypothetical protein
MSSVSSIVPPTFLTMRISRRSTFEDVGVTRRVTAETAIGARMDEYWETICTTGQISTENSENRRALEFKDVLAALISVVRSLRSIGVDISVRNSTAFAEAFKKDSAMIVG